MAGWPGGPGPAARAHRASSLMPGSLPPTEQVRSAPRVPGDGWPRPPGHAGAGAPAGRRAPAVTRSRPAADATAAIARHGRSVLAGVVAPR